MSRGARLGRLEDLQRRRRQMAEWRLAELSRRVEALDADARTLLESLGDQSLLHGLFLEGRANRLRRVEMERRQAVEEREAAREALNEIARVEKRLERLQREAEAVERRAGEARALAEILDGRFAAGAASLE